MFRNYFLIALRNVRKHLMYSLINVVGLAIGLTCCMLIILYVIDELSYDAHHERADRIYRVIEDIDLHGVVENSASAPFPVAEQLLNEYDEIEAAVRFFRPQGGYTMRYGEKIILEDQLFFADSTVFEVFSYEFIAGDHKTALDAPNTIVVTQTAARKYFGAEDPMGKTLLASVGGPQPVGFVVTGVIKDPPLSSHFSFSILASFPTLRNFFPPALFQQQWWGNPCWTYILLPNDNVAARLESQLPDFVKKYFPENIRDGISLGLQPLRSIHLHSNRDLEIEPNSDIDYVYIFTAVAILILMIACINFMNLATARSQTRALEVGLRKTLGAQRGQLIAQFLSESTLIAGLSVVLSVILIETLLPTFNAFAGKELTIDWLSDMRYPLALVGIGIVVGIIAGSYPAFFLSAFNTVNTLKGSKTQGTRSSLLRKALVTVQFGATIVLLICSGIVYDQIDYIRNKPLGFDCERVMLLQMAPPLFQQYQAFKNELLRTPGVDGVTGMTEKVGTGVQIRQYIPEGATQAEPIALAGLGVDIDFLDVFDIEVVDGRGFSREFPTDATQGYILNESAARQLGWDDPIGKQFKMYTGGGQTRDGTIIGITRDFNYASLHQPIESLVLFVFGFQHIAVKIAPNEVAGAIAGVETTWKKFCPEVPFAYSFLGDGIDRLYRSEENLGAIIMYFSIFAIFVACLGLFGLAAFMAEQRTKEIGIRKTLGAPVLTIVFLLTKDFSKLVLIAALAAAPLAYFAMQRWLEDFAYRTAIGWEIFIQATLLSLAIALITVSFKTIKAALANPVDAIRADR